MDRTDGAITLHQAMVQMTALVNEEGMAHERECWDVIERTLTQPQPGPATMTEPCMFPNLHEPFYCRIHADVRLRLTDERCRRGVTLTQPQPDGCGECQGWPGHHSGCSKYGIPRTEAGARLLVTLENLIYRGGTIGDVARIDIVSIEDEAEVRAANRAALRSTPAPETAHQHRFDVVIRDDEHMRLLGCSNTPCEEAYQWDR